MAFLEIRNLKKRFGSTQVLHGINFSMEEGEAVAVIGSSGGGKTTFLRCLNFLEMADEGTIRIEGGFAFDAAETYTPAQIRAMRLKMGLVFQSFNLFPQYTALENIYLPMQLRTIEQLKKEIPNRRSRRAAINRAQEENRARAQELLASVGLAQKAENYPCQLSGGQQQRVAIARALSQTPAVLCFDEPTSALDPELTGEVLRVIKDLKDKGCTLLVVTHEMEFARKVADRVVFVADGLIEEEGTPEEIFRNPRSPKTAAFLQHTVNQL
ncbi:MAG: amino acid ABC transporter ATP-binding protein [Clostridia bacterium]|nr:amino acid ABC transporter ATP-binding protein [Clostridia bacterium]MBQ7339160.1 amino acid ABC transporter ATP-binding protein [Clostridia bacterium]